MISKKISNEPDPESEQAIREIALEKMRINDDGFFFLSFLRNQFIRTLDPKGAKQYVDESSFDNIMLHWRFASAGEVTPENVHGWIEGDYQFLHNGHIADYAPKGVGKFVNNRWEKPTQEFTDSYLLFIDIVNELKNEKQPGHKRVARAIRTAVGRVNFWGRAVMYDRSSDRAFLFGDWHLYLFNENYLVISSSELDINGKKSQNVHGIPFTVTENMHVTSGEMDGISVIKNFSKSEFQYKYLMDLKESYSYKPTPVTSTPTKPIGFSTETDATKLDDLDDELERGGWGKHGSVSNYTNKNSYVSDDPQLDFMLNEEGDEIEVYTDETGTHDIYNECCDYNRCNKFTPAPRKPKLLKQPTTPETQAMVENLLSQVGQAGK